jgi:hypothetical protein
MGLRGRALDLAILSRWSTGEAREERLSVSEEEASQQLELLRFDERTGTSYEGLPHEPMLRRLLVSSRVATSDRLWLMRVALLEAKVERARHARAAQAVSREEVARFYREHKQRFLQPARREIEMLGSYSRAVVMKAKLEIEDGKPFLAVARRVSVDGEAPEGLENLVRGTDEAEVEDPVFAARPHVLSGPYKYILWFLFEVLKVVPAHQQTLAEAEGAIRRQLAPGVVASRLLPAFEAKWMARTSCRAGYVIARCRQYKTETARGR